MQIALYITSLAAGTAITSAAVIPKAKDNANFMKTLSGKQVVTHYEAQPLLAPITGKFDPAWSTVNPFVEPTDQAGDPSVEQRFQASRKGEPVL